MDSNFRTMGLDLELLPCFIKLQKLKVRVSFRKSKSKMNKKNHYTCKRDFVVIVLVSIVCKSSVADL
jgi:hypothetical protein